MAVALNQVEFEVRTGGDDTNGGGFDTIGAGGGTDYSQQTSSQVTLTTASTVNATTTVIDVDSGDHTPVAADVGNMVQISGGTATAGYYLITASGSGQWTLDRSAGTVGQTVAGEMGGCLASPGELTNALTTAKQVAHIQKGTYTLTTATAGPDGPMDLSVSGADKELRVFGYNLVHYDIKTLADRVTANMPTIDVGSVTNIVASTGGVIKTNGGTSPGEHVVLGIHVLGGGAADNNTGFQGTHSNTCFAILCVAEELDDNGFRSFGCIGCHAEATTYGFNACSGSVYCSAAGDGTNDTNFTTCSGLYKCTHDGKGSNYVYSFNQCNGAKACVAYDAGRTQAFLNAYGVFVECVAYDVGEGFNYVGYYPGVYINCIAEYCGHGGSDPAFAGTGEEGTYICCADYNSYAEFGSGVRESQKINFQTLTSSPFVDPSTARDFNLNDTAGAGAVCREEGFGSPHVNDDFATWLGALHAEGEGGGGGGGGLRLVGPGGLVTLVD